MADVCSCPNPHPFLQNFPNFKKFPGKIAARREFCIVDDIFAPPPPHPRHNPQATALDLLRYEHSMKSDKLLVMYVCEIKMRKFVLALQTQDKILYSRRHFL